MTKLLSTKYLHTDWPCMIKFSLHSFIYISLSKTKTPRIPIHHPNPLQHPIKCTNVHYINTFYEHDNTTHSFIGFNHIKMYKQFKITYNWGIFTVLYAAHACTCCVLIDYSRPINSVSYESSFASSAV